MNAAYRCAGCGEWNETVVDYFAGPRQRYAEDCQVCCKPNVLLVTWDSEAEEYVVQAELEQRCAFAANERSSGARPCDPVRHPREGSGVLSWLIS